MKARAPEVDASARDALNADARANAMRMDIVLRQAFVGGRELSLAPKEFSLLYVLLENVGETMGAAELTKAIGAMPGDRSVDSLVYRLRKKLRGSDYAIVTERKQGYRLENNATDCNK